MDPIKWPAWYYGPNGEAEIFQKAEDVPKGWQDHPGKHKARKEKADDKRDDDDDDDKAGTGGLTREQIVADLERRKVFFKANASTKTLYRLLMEAIEKDA